MSILAGLYRPDAGDVGDRRPAGALRLAARRDRARHRHGLPALHAGRAVHRRRERAARRARPGHRPGDAPRSSASLASSASGIGLQRRSAAPRSGSSRSASSSGSRSCACSIAARGSSSSTSRPPCSPRRRRPSLMRTLRADGGRRVLHRLHLPQARRGAGRRRPDHRPAPRARSSPRPTAADNRPPHAGPADGRARAGALVEHPARSARGRRTARQSVLEVRGVCARSATRAAGAARRRPRRARGRDPRHRRGGRQRSARAWPRSITGLRPADGRNACASAGTRSTDRSAGRDRRARGSRTSRRTAWPTGLIAGSGPRRQRDPARLPLARRWRAGRSWSAARDRRVRRPPDA